MFLVTPVIGYCGCHAWYIIVLHWVRYIASKMLCCTLLLRHTIQVIRNDIQKMCTNFSNHTLRFTIHLWLTIRFSTTYEKVYGVKILWLSISKANVFWRLNHLQASWFISSWLNHSKQSGRSPKVVALFSATNFSRYIIELLQLHDAIQIQWNYTWIHYNIAIRRHLMI